MYRSGEKKNKKIFWWGENIFIITWPSSDRTRTGGILSTDGYVRRISMEYNFWQISGDFGGWWWESSKIGGFQGLNECIRFGRLGADAPKSAELSVD
jgi:hypothetical protein